MRIVRAALLVVACVMAMPVDAARADFIITDEGTATSTINSTIARYKDNGTLLWSTPIDVYTNNAGITSWFATTSALSADGGTVYSSVWTRNSSGALAGGEIMALNALTGAVKNITSLAGNGFDRAYSITAAADGTLWLGAEYPGSSGSSWSAVHLNSDLSVRETSARCRLSGEVFGALPWTVPETPSFPAVKKTPRSCTSFRPPI